MACGVSAEWLSEGIGEHAKLRIRACTAAERFVTTSLKAPSTAKFPSCGSYEYRTNDAMDTWQVSDHVDAQNAFGAMIRSKFSVLMTQAHGNFSPTSITIE